jgi:vacuolar-type H+-ATPase subunit C/Vma6
MGAGWVAGVTRARALRTRALGAERLREVAATGTLDDALRGLRTTAYGRDVTPDASTADAQRAVSAALLWHLRVLAGWQPREGAQAVRTLAAGFEMSNVQEHLRSLTGPPLPGPPRAPYRLGALATAWPRLSRARTPGEVRALLAASPWGGCRRPRPARRTAPLRRCPSSRTAPPSGRAPASGWRRRRRRQGRAVPRPGPRPR